MKNVFNLRGNVQKYGISKWCKYTYPIPLIISIVLSGCFEDVVEDYVVKDYVANCFLPYRWWWVRGVWWCPRAVGQWRWTMAVNGGGIWTHDSPVCAVWQVTFMMILPKINLKDFLLETGFVDCDLLMFVYLFVLFRTFYCLKSPNMTAIFFLCILCTHLCCVRKWLGVLQEIQHVVYKLK